METTNTNERVQEHHQFDGLRNDVPPERFTLSDLAIAKNIDLDDEKEATRRKGYSAPVIAGDIKSLYAFGGVCLAVKDDTDLIRIFPDYTFETIRSDLNPGLDISYWPIGTNIAWSNGEVNGVIDKNTGARSWGIEVPPSQGNGQSMGGVLRSGRYQWAITYVRDDGQISGTDRSEAFDVTEGGLRITDIPVSSDPSVAYKVIWATETDAENLYRAGTIANEDTEFQLVAPFKQTVLLPTQFFGPPPPGSIVRSFNGHSLVVVGNTLYYSEPFAYELFDLRKNYRFSNEITLVEATEGGVYLGTSEEVIWMNGRSPRSWVLEHKFSYGAIPRTSARCSADMLSDQSGNGDAIIFTSKEGICIGLDGGQITNVTQDRFRFPVAERGAGMIRRYKGTVQYVTALRN